MERILVFQIKEFEKAMLQMSEHIYDTRVSGSSTCELPPSHPTKETVKFENKKQ